MNEMITAINNWLMTQALSDDPFEVTLKQFAERVLDGGIPIARISIGRSVLHPVFGLVDMQWDQDSNLVQTQTVRRDEITADFLTGSPFADLTKGKYTSSLKADLTDPDEVARYKIFDKLAKSGMTGYIAFARNFGARQEVFTRLSSSFRGTSMSFATRRFSGFADSDHAGLEYLVPALCTCIRVDNDRLLANEVLEAYLGRKAGRQVLTGRISRGDGEKIDCVILYSDLRGSLALSQDLELNAYLETVNRYFDCVATAVLDHGGEVLKFIGDGVLAIFPVDDETRPRANMCSAALSAAREALARAAHANRSREKNNLPPIDFGVSLHAGEVIYGNVGTIKRLDFTATGPAVGLAARLEGLTRTLDTPIIASGAFAAACPETGDLLEPQCVRSFAEPVEIVGFTPET